MTAAAFAAPMMECAMSYAIPRRNVVLGTAALGLSALARPRVARAAEAAWSEQPAHPLAERLAAYAHGLRYTDIDAATIEAVKTHVVDTMGCAIAARDEKPVRACRLVALAAGAGGTATVIGTNSRSTPELAAFANSVAGRYYDLNDVYVVQQGAIRATSSRGALRSPKPSGRARATSSPRSPWLTRSIAGCSTRSTSPSAAGTAPCSRSRRPRLRPAS
jgi:hypothetical protein